MKLRPVEYNVVIKPKAVELKTKGGIILTSKTVEADKLAADEGEIVAVSDLAFNYDDYPEASRPKVGDVVKFGRYAGTTILNDAGEIEYRIVKDKDIWAVVEPMGEVVQFRPVDANEPAPAPFFGKPMARCMGGRFCNHAPRTCTADPEYQAAMKAQTPDALSVPAVDLSGYVDLPIPVKTDA